MQEVSANKAMKKQLENAKFASNNAEALKAELHKCEQQLMTWRSENTALRHKITSLETISSRSPRHGGAKAKVRTMLHY